MKANASTVDGAAVLKVEDLKVTFAAGARTIRAVDGVSFGLRLGETLAIVGESGSGKSTTGLAIMGLVERSKGATISGSIRLATKSSRVIDINRLRPRELRAVRGKEIAMIFQEPMSSLNPVFSIGSQIEEAIHLHGGPDARSTRRRSLEILEELGIASPDRCLASYPHQLSGGMRQRIMIAIALCCHPSVLIADEPTTALDVTIQAQILELLKRVQHETGMAMIFITHNLGVVAEIADRTLVMYAGDIVESLRVRDLFGRARMPYTRGLLRSLPVVGRARKPGEKLAAIPGNVPNAGAIPPGCAFHPRCGFAVPGHCDRQRPTLERVKEDQAVRCLRWREIGAEAAG
jgi:oligopeptide/dipeptide ABC transporter ATP-binding protein